MQLIKNLTGTVLTGPKLYWSFLVSSVTMCSRSIAYRNCRMQDLASHTASQMVREELLYKQVALRISELIEHGTLRPGNRLPSVRRCSQQQDVSIATVTQAYRWLEDRGLIEARPQSGYYVRPKTWSPTP